MQIYRDLLPCFLQSFYSAYQGSVPIVAPDQPFRQKLGQENPVMGVLADNADKGLS
jgi:hypothetical protein